MKFKVDDLVKYTDVTGGGYNHDLKPSDKDYLLYGVVVKA